MRRISFIFVAALLAAVFLLLIFRNRIVLSVAKKQIEKIFSGATVSLGGCEVNPLASLELREVRIKKSPAYDFKIGAIRLDYRLAGLLSGDIGQVSVKETAIMIDTPQRKIADFTRNLNLKKTGRSFAIGVLAVSGTAFDLNCSDLLTLADLDAKLGVKDLAVISAALSVRSLKTPFAELRGFSMAVAQNQEGKISFEELRMNKIKVTGAAGMTRLQGSRLDINNLSAGLLDGRITVNAGIKIAAVPDYSVDAAASGLSLERFARDFELTERFEAAGLLEGSLRLEGTGGSLRIMDGDFSVQEPGGKLIIKDKQFLERMAAGTNQSLNIIVENFRDYHYNTGIIKVGLEQGNIVLGAELEGLAGKRSLEIVLHDFFTKEVGK